MLVVEQERCQCFTEFRLTSQLVVSQRAQEDTCLADSSWAKEEERCDRPVGRLQSGTGHPDGVTKGLNDMILPNYAILKCFFHLKDGMGKTRVWTFFSSNSHVRASRALGILPKSISHCP